MVKKSNEYTIDEAFHAFLAEARLTPQYHFQKVKADWENLVGPEFARETLEIWFEKPVLHLKLSSPAWKTEMAYGRGLILRRLNQAVGYSLFKEIVVH